MRRAAISVLACVLAAASPPGAAAQGRSPSGRPDGSPTTGAGLLARLIEERPHLVVWPMAALLGDGTHEQRLDMRATWPATDTAPDVALHLLAGLNSGQEAYGRSGLRIDVRERLGPTRLTGSASVSAGSGAGPRQAFSLAIGSGIHAISFEVRTTWLQGGPTGINRTPESGVPNPGLPLPSRTHEGRYTDGELHAERPIGRAGIRFTGGQRFGGEAHGTPRWLFGVAEIPIRRRFGIALAGGTRPERVDLGQSGGRFAQLALRLDFSGAPRIEPVDPPDPLPATHAVVPLAPGRYQLLLHLPGARRVELKGDVTDWNVVSLHRSTRGDDVWETQFEKPSGIYHINIRVDGGDWIVPHGLVTVPDRFGGTVAVLILPPIEEVNDAE